MSVLYERLMETFQQNHRNSRSLEYSDIVDANIQRRFTNVLLGRQMPTYKLYFIAKNFILETLNMHTTLLGSFGYVRCSLITCMKNTFVVFTSLQSELLRYRHNLN